MRRAGCFESNLQGVKKFDRGKEFQGPAPGFHFLFMMREWKFARPITSRS
jgi:hypothetical protein